MSKKIFAAFSAIALLAGTAAAVSQTSTNQPDVRRAELIDNLRSGHNQVVVDIGAIITALGTKATNATLTLQTLALTGTVQNVAVVTNVTITVQK